MCLGKRRAIDCGGPTGSAQSCCSDFAKCDPSSGTTSTCVQKPTLNECCTDWCKQDEIFGSYLTNPHWYGEGNPTDGAFFHDTEFCNCNLALHPFAFGYDYVAICYLNPDNIQYHTSGEITVGNYCNDVTNMYWKCNEDNSASTILIQMEMVAMIASWER